MCYPDCLNRECVRACVYIYKNHFRQHHQYGLEIVLKIDTSLTQFAGMRLNSMENSILWQPDLFINISFSPFIVTNQKKTERKKPQQQRRILHQNGMNAVTLWFNTWALFHFRNWNSSVESKTQTRIQQTHNSTPAKIIDRERKRRVHGIDWGRIWLFKLSLHRKWKML